MVTASEASRSRQLLTRWYWQCIVHAYVHTHTHTHTHIAGIHAIISTKKPTNNNSNGNNGNYLWGQEADADAANHDSAGGLAGLICISVTTSFLLEQCRLQRKHWSRDRIINCSISRAHAAHGWQCCLFALRDPARSVANSAHIRPVVVNVRRIERFKTLQIGSCAIWFKSNITSFTITNEIRQLQLSCRQGRR